jgi:hypothetical protein
VMRHLWRKKGIPGLDREESRGRRLKAISSG